MTININGTTGISGVDGSAGTPAIQGSDTNTGVFFGTNTIDLSTDGTSRLSIDSSGNVGIGDTSPSYILDISGSSPDIQLNDTDASGQAYRIQSTNGALRIVNTGVDERLRIDSSGRLLIGTNSSTANTAGDDLQIAGSSDRGLTITSGSTSSANIYLGDDGDTDRCRIAYQNNDDALDFSTNGGGTDVRLNSSGRLLVASTTSRTNVNGLEPQIQVEGINNDTSTVALISNNTSDGTAAQVHLCKSSAGTVGSNGAVVNNELLGRVSFDGSDGTNFIAGAQVLSTCEANAATNDMTANLRVYVNNGSSSPEERFRVSATGEIFHYANEYAHTLSTGSTNASVQAFRVRNGATGMGGGTTRFAVNADGDCENTNNRYTGFSDVKLKENIVDAGSQWDDIKALQIRKYNYKEETGFGTHTQIGLIAQEVELVSPGLIGETRDRETYEVERTDENGNTVVELKERDAGTVTKSVAYSVLYMKSVKALQEAMTRIETLEARLSVLEGGAN